LRARSLCCSGISHHMPTDDIIEEQPICCDA
jgi:hypothetical protein